MVESVGRVGREGTITRSVMPTINASREAGFDSSHHAPRDEEAQRAHESQAPLNTGRTPEAHSSAKLHASNIFSNGSRSASR
jgi:hypothetical protein